MENPKCYNLNMALLSQYFYVVVRYIYHSVLNFEAENEFFVYKVEYRILLKMLATAPAGIERIKIFLPLCPSGVQCSVFTSVQGFEALYLISIQSLCTSTKKIQMKKTIPLNIIVSASKFSKLKGGSGICNCCGNFTIREKNPLLLRHHDVINFGSCYL